MGVTGPADAIFEKVKAQLRAQLGTEVFSSWFASMRVSDASPGIVRLSVATAFLKGWINGHYLDLVSRLWQEQDPKVLRVEIIVRSTNRALRPVQDGATAIPKPSGGTASVLPLPVAKFDKAFAKAASPETRRQGVLGSPLDARYTFDSFVEGSANRVALAAAKSVAEQKSRFNPLFVHAAVGLGKTHLLQAIAAESIRLAPGTRVVYLTAEYFMWRFATAIRDNNALSFKEQLRDIDILIIDDMQFLQGKSIQNEFCHLINMLLDSAKQVVVAADRPPAELESLEPRVRSRLNGGVALEMGAPDHAMRLHMLKLRVEAAKIEDPTFAIGEDIIEHVALTVTASGRELEGAFNQLLFRRGFEPDLTVERVDDLLGHIYRSGEPRKTRIEDIQRVVARHYNVSKTELLSNRRTRTIVKPRQVAMYLSKIMTPRSLPEIGRRFGNRDHTTVLHAVRKIEDLRGNDTTLAQEVELLRRLILEQA